MSVDFDLDSIVAKCHNQSMEAGWWDDLKEVQSHLPTKELKAKVESWFLATKIALIHSELGEMLEGLRKGINDDHLEQFKMEDVEAADVFIRLADYMGYRGMWLSILVDEKLKYNENRSDHKVSNRKKEGGKKF